MCNFGYCAQQAYSNNLILTPPDWTLYRIITPFVNLFGLVQHDIFLTFSMGLATVRHNRSNIKLKDLLLGQ